MSSHISHTLVGQTIDGRYEVLERLGDGGMGEVYLALDRRTGNRVAVKLPWPQLAKQPREPLRFDREIRALSQLEHPCIVRLLDVVEHAGRRAQVMHHFGGGTLEQNRQVAVDRWLPRIAGALDYIHGQGLVHRDVKPENIFFDAHETAYLGDFGIVKPLERGATVTQQGFTVGTPAYMSPEAVRGQELDGRADQYALAMLVYEHLAGQLPFEVDTPPQLRQAHVAFPPRQLYEVDSRYSEATSAVLARALAKDRTERFDSCGEFAKALLESLQVLPPPSASANVPGTQDPVPTDPPPSPSLPTSAGSDAAAVGLWRRVSPRVRRWSIGAASAVVCVSVVAVANWVRVENARVARIAQERIAAEKAERDRIEAEEARQRKIAAEKAERDRIEAEEARQRKITAQKAERDRIEAEEARQRKIAAEKAKQEKIAAEKAEQERIAARLAAAERVARASPRLTAAQQSVGNIVINSIGMVLVPIPAGIFQMGAPESETDGVEADGPVRRVRIAKPYYLGMYEVTQSEYERVMGENPSHLKGPQLPVERVSWDEAKEFCRKLSALPEERAAGRTYRLPTAAGWEYACRAGTTTPFHFGGRLSGRAANCDGNHPYGTSDRGPYLERTAPVGSYQPNAFGLHDMHGNVWEWCADWDNRAQPAAELAPVIEASRLACGGGWDTPPRCCRSAHRHGFPPDTRSSNLGFRVAQLLAE